MDQNTASFILKSIETLQKKQQTVIKEVMKINDAFRNTIEKMRKEKEEEKSVVEIKLEEFDKRSERFETALNNNEAEIAKIVTEKENLHTAIKEIDEKIDEYKENIDLSLKKIEDLKTEKK